MEHVRIFTRSTCPYCVGAKRFLQELGVDYEETVLDDRPDLAARLREENDGWQTVPMIFIGERFVGGFDDVRRLHGERKLLPLLQGR